MTRFSPLDPDALSDAQRAVVDDVRRGRRGTVPANVVAWLPNPELAKRAASLGELVRYETALPPRWSELAILVVARHWSCAYEWAVQVAEAAVAGLEAEIVAAVGHGVAQPKLDGLDAVVHGFARELRDHRPRLGRALRQRLRRPGRGGGGRHHRAGGVLTFVAFTLNAREVPPPEGGAQLPPLG